MLIMFCLIAFIMPAMAANGNGNKVKNTDSSGGGGGGVDYGEMFDVKGSMSEMESSSLQKPVKQTTNLLIYAVVLVVFYSLAIGLIKYLAGNSDHKSDGLMHMGKVAIGLVVFVACLLLAGGMFGWI